MAIETPSTADASGFQVCPRCKEPFCCQPQNIAACQCAGLALAPQTREKLAAQYEGCLCRTCLQGFENPEGPVL